MISSLNFTLFSPIATILVELIENYQMHRPERVSHVGKSMAELPLPLSPVIIDSLLGRSLEAESLSYPSTHVGAYESAENERKMFSLETRAGAIWLYLPKYS
jgi:hypothetical protein